MTPLRAQVLAVDPQGDRYHVIVQIGCARYRGSFNTLAFGEVKPAFGLCHDGRLDLVYHRDPGLEAGQPFPLWTIHYPHLASRKGRTPPVSSLADRLAGRPLNRGLTG